MTRLLVLLAVAACAASLAPQALGYGWPLKPSGKQHPVRGNFEDPRMAGTADGGASHSFHFGVDISAPDGTWVYAVAPGSAIVRGNTVRVRAPIADGYREFGYWHVWPAVDTGDRIRLHQPIGQVAPGYGHVHFSEARLGNFLNPLRPGALTPYSDRTRPVVAGVSFSGERGLQGPYAVSGTVDLLVTAYDLPPLAPPEPWNLVRLSPALIQWRIVRDGIAVVPWTIAVDFRWSLLPRWYFDQVYAPGTRQNKPRRPGNYVYYLAHSFDSRVLENGAYVLDVAASDTRGNTGTGAVRFTIAN